MGNNIVREADFVAFQREIESAVYKLKIDLNELRCLWDREHNQREKAILDFLYSEQTPFPALEIKHCPLCGIYPHWWTVGPHLLVKCNNPGCKLYDAPGMSSKDWNERRA